MDTRFIIDNVPDNLDGNIVLLYNIKSNNINSNIKFNRGDIVQIKLKISFKVEDGLTPDGNGILYHLEDIKNSKYFETVAHNVKYKVDEDNIIQIVNVSLTHETIEIINNILQSEENYRKANLKFE